MRTKSPANRLGMYAEVRQILDAALANGGGRYECPTHGQAVHWRQRAYKFRKLYAETMATSDSFSMSPYDRLTMPQIPEDSSTVIINIRESIGKFIPNRDPSDVTYVPVPGDPLFDVAAGLAKKIKEGEL